MRRKIKLKTIEGNDIDIKMSKIKNMYNNLITMKFSYLEWLKNGTFEEEKFELSPESLKVLIKQLEETKNGYKLIHGSSRIFIESFPTTKTLEEYIEKIKKLPKIESE